MRRRVPIIGLSALVSLLGCGGDETDGTGAGGSPPSSCGPTELPNGDDCVTTGVTECAAGFTLDPETGCVAILPDTPCGPGQMALPGETVCREVAPCGDGPWGEIPVNGTTEHVDTSFSASSDGSASAPWKTIGEAVDAAAPGAIVAVAAGTYGEEVVIMGKAVTLWGRCPAMVSVEGPPNTSMTIRVQGVAAAGTRVRGIAVVAPQVSLGILGATDVSVEQVWLHDGGERGFYLDDNLGPGSATLRASLVEGVVFAGVYTAGDAPAVVEDSVIRGIQPPAGMSTGSCATTEYNPGSGAPGSLVVRRSLLEGCPTAGASAAASVLEVEDSLLRHNHEPDGIGVGVYGTMPAPVAQAGVPNTITVRRSVVEHNGSAGVVVEGGSALIEQVTARDNGWLFSMVGSGFEVTSTDGQRAAATMRDTLSYGNVRGGAFLVATDATFERVRIANTQPAEAGLFGRGLQVQSDVALGASSFLAAWTLVQGNHDHGVVVLSSTVELQDSVVRDTRKQVEQDIMGDGIASVSDAGPTAVTVNRSIIAGNARAGISSFGAALALGSTRLDCNAIDLDGELFMGQDAAFTDLGDNRCGCGEDSRACQIVSTNLAPPGGL
ncbi:MAG: DUF1565 domain-containing protein [Deltaproteobacteria bacterium]|nr:DUF1565 domain-containing protein [Deltaproteobacteria bacterium]